MKIWSPWELSRTSTTCFGCMHANRFFTLCTYAGSITFLANSCITIVAYLLTLILQGTRMLVNRSYLSTCLLTDYLPSFYIFVYVLNYFTDLNKTWRLTFFKILNSTCCVQTREASCRIKNPVSHKNSCTKTCGLSLKKTMICAK